MADLFYVLLAIPLVLEMWVIGGARLVPDKYKRWYEEKQVPNGEKGEYGIITLMGFSYVVLAISGLFSSQWPVFVALLALSLLNSAHRQIFKRRIAGYMVIDATLSIMLLVFAMVNHFHRIYKF